jgi:cytoskeletal protein CcmA (bactofilin family)
LQANKTGFKRGSEKRERARPSAEPSILSSDLKIKGDIVSLGALQISGSVKGSGTTENAPLS